MSDLSMILMIGKIQKIAQKKEESCRSDTRYPRWRGTRLHRIASHRVTRKREREREGEGRGEREERRKEKEIEQCQPEVEWSTDVEDEDEDEDENDGDGGDEDEDDVDEIRQGEWADARRAGKQHRSSSRAFRGRDNSACYSAHAPVIHVLSQLLRPPRSLGALGPRRLARRGRYSPV